MAEAATTGARDAGIAAHRAGRLDEALRHYADHLDRAPQDAGIWSNLGVVLRQKQLHDQALRAQERAIALDPQAEGIRSNYANVLSDIGRYDDSIALRRLVLAERPGDAMHKAMIGRCLRGKGAYAEAIAYLQTAIAAHPDEAELRIQLAFAQLGAGDHLAGFANYRARWKGGELTPRNLPWPEWQGGDAARKTLLVLPEQGFGDAVLFARYLPRLKNLGARVLFHVDRPLQRLFSALPGIDRSGGLARPDEPVDAWVNLMDLPLADPRAKPGIPPPAPLHVPQEARQRARRIVAPFREKFRIGVVWTGSVTYKGNVFRSFSHREFLPLADMPGVQLFSLYKGPELAAYQADGSNAFILDTASTDHDFADCAATMQEMDLIITSDTATAHIAGSLGLPTWVVLHWDAFWVYTHAGETTPWYPTMRLFRQDRPRDWSAPFKAIMAELPALQEARA